MTSLLSRSYAKEVPQASMLASMMTQNVAAGRLRFRSVVM
jgi:hypothetical protein